MNIVILAAGMGKRMNSDLPKVLHPLAGKSLLGHVVDTARTLGPQRLVVVFGHGGEQVQAAFEGQDDLQWARQSPQLGTGHAVAQTVPMLDDEVPTLVLYGDVPLVTVDTLKRLAEAASQGQLALLTEFADDPTGYGRIVRDGNGKVQKIVEQKDADAATLKINEVNTGILIAPTAPLKRWLAALKNDNAQNEYYLTDVIAAAVADGTGVTTAHPAANWETLGVNSKTQLAFLERRHQRNLADRLTDSGVMLADPDRIDIRGQLDCGRDVAIDVGCVFEGEVRLGKGVRIGPNCVLKDCIIGDGTHVLPMSVIDSARVGTDNRIGPFARLRPGTELGDDNHIGNFVERTGMASGHPSISTTMQAPDHCSCNGMMCSLGKAHSQGRITSVASIGVSSAPPRKRRQGRISSDSSSVPASRRYDQSICRAPVPNRRSRPRQTTRTRIHGRHSRA